MNKEVIYYPREAIVEAADKFETPFFLYEEARLRTNCQRFRDAFKKYFSDFQPLYAVKANPNPEVLKIIASEGFEMDASSDAEIWLCEKLGLKGMYTGNYTPAESLKFAKDRDFILNLDDISMLPFLKEIGVPEIISFRINPGVGKATMANNVFAGPDAKYGIPFEKAAEAYRQAAEIGVKRFGIHMMTGSNVPMNEKNYFAEIVRKLLQIVADVKAQTGVEIELLNMGGGFGVPYKPEEESLNIEDVAESVHKAFEDECAKLNIKAPRLMAEPGRWISADAGWLVAKVVVIKDSYKKFVGIDASSNDMPRPSIYDAYHHVSVINDSNESEIVNIVGSICENCDQFAKSRDLPVCNIGDIVVIHNCGAHAFAMGHNYNGKLRHAEYLLESSGNLRQIRRAETFDDLYATIKI